MKFSKLGRSCKIAPSVVRSGWEGESRRRNLVYVCEDKGDLSIELSSVSFFCANEKALPFGQSNLYLSDLSLRRLAGLV